MSLHKYEDETMACQATGVNHYYYKYHKTNELS